MSKQPKDLPIRRHLPLHLKLDLGLHEQKLILHLVRLQVPADLDKLPPRLIDLAVADELARRVGHEGGQSDKQNHAPGNLDPERQTPLDRAVGCIPARHADPVGHHGAKANAAARDAANKPAVRGRGDLAEVDGHGRDKAPARERWFSSSFGQQSPPWGLWEDLAGTYPTAIPARARPARNMPMLTDAVWITVPTVTTAHITCMNRTRPSLSAIAVCVRAPTASPPMYTETTCDVVCQSQHT